MCNPVFIGFALSAASTVMEQQAAEASADAANKNAEAQARNATQATLNDYSQTAQRDLQEQSAAAQELDQNQMAAARQQATARVSSGEAGVSGLSIDALERGYKGQELRNSDVIQRNLAFQQQQSAQTRKSIYTTGKGRVNQAAASMKTKPSRLGAALQIGGAGLDAYTKLNP